MNGLGSGYGVYMYGMHLNGAYGDEMMLRYGIDVLALLQYSTRVSK